MTITLFIIAVVLITLGVGFIYWPAALICLGLMFGFTAWKLNNLPPVPEPETSTNA